MSDFFFSFNAFFLGPKSFFALTISLHENRLFSFTLFSFVLSRFSSLGHMSICFRSCSFLVHVQFKEENNFILSLTALLFSLKLIIIRTNPSFFAFSNVELIYIDDWALMELQVIIFHMKHVEHVIGCCIYVHMI